MCRADDQREYLQPELVDEVMRDQGLSDAGTTNDDQILGRLARDHLSDELAWSSCEFCHSSTRVRVRDAMSFATVFILVENASSREGQSREKMRRRRPLRSFAHFLSPARTLQIEELARGL